jgi:hypothetical protein
MLWFYFLNRDYAAGLAIAAKNRFRELLIRGKYPRVFVLEAELSLRRQGSIIFAEKGIFSQNLKIGQSVDNLLLDHHLSI